MHALEAQLNRGLLDYAVGRALFCPLCDVLLDSRRAVLMMPGDGPCAVLCGECYDAMRDRLTAVEDAAFVRAVELTDGRLL